MVHRRLIRLLYLALLCPLTPSLNAQTKASDSQPGWTFSTSAGYSNVTNAPTNNGFANVTELKLSTSIAIRGDVFLMTNPQMIGSYVGPEYILPANKLFKSNPNNPVNSDNVEFFFNAKVGDIRSSDPTNTTKAKFSWGVGGGFNIKLSDKTFIRPLDISYIRGSVFQGGGTVIGNHLQAAALLGVRF